MLGWLEFLFFHGIQIVNLVEEVRAYSKLWFNLLTWNSDFRRDMKLLSLYFIFVNSENVIVDWWELVTFVVW